MQVVSRRSLLTYMGATVLGAFLPGCKKERPAECLKPKGFVNRMDEYQREIMGACERQLPTKLPPDAGATAPKTIAPEVVISGCVLTPDKVQANKTNVEITVFVTLIKDGRAISSGKPKELRVDLGAGVTVKSTNVPRGGVLTLTVNTGNVEGLRDLTIEFGEVFVLAKKALTIYKPRSGGSGSSGMGSGMGSGMKPDTGGLEGI